MSVVVRNGPFGVFLIVPPAPAPPLLHSAPTGRQNTSAAPLGLATYRSPSPGFHPRWGFHPGLYSSAPSGLATIECPAAFPGAWPCFILPQGNSVPVRTHPYYGRRDPRSPRVPCLIFGGDDAILTSCKRKCFAFFSRRVRNRCIAGSRKAETASRSFNRLEGFYL